MFVNLLIKIVSNQVLNSWMNLKKKFFYIVDEMAQWIKLLASKPLSMGLIPRSHFLEVEKSH